MKSMSYGQAVSGVPNTVLLAQRRVVAAATAPAVGTRGQCLDMALVITGGKASGIADPAFDAHMMPIGQRAQVVWREWLPFKNLEKSTISTVLKS